MFRGRSNHNIDEKGRIAIPVRFKDVLKARDETCLVVTNHESSLWVYAREDWRAIEEKAAKLPQFDRAATAYLRYFISGATECLIKQGRITIPPMLREFAGLEKEVVLVGELTRFEVWEKRSWEEEFTRAKEIFAEAGQSLSEFGI